MAEFDWLGRDHWFRLFLPAEPNAELVLPVVRGRSWWKPYLAIPEHQRPLCSNYTVADLRRTADGAEMDIDVVLHWDESGKMAGPVATWATTAAVGSPLALLDQGPLFDPPSDVRDIHLASDETGLPGLRGILRDLPPDAAGTAIIEVPDVGDVEELAAPAAIEIVWLPRADHSSVPGAAALAELLGRASPHRDDYAFIVGESSLATEGRRAMHRAGLPKSRITFSGFWKHE